MSSGKGSPADADERDGERQESEHSPSAAEQKRQEIRDSILALKDLSQSDISFGDFCQQVMAKIIPLTAAHGAVVWHVDNEQRIEMVFATGPASAESLVKGAAHHKLLADVVASQHPQSISARTLAEAEFGEANAMDRDEEGDTSPQDMLLMVAPIVNRDQRCWGIFELLQRGDINASVQQGYLKFLAQIAGLFTRWWERHAFQRQAAPTFSAKSQMSLPVASETAAGRGPSAPAPASATRRHEPVQAASAAAASASASSSGQHLHEQLEFVREIHQSIQQLDTVYSVANAARRLLQCDRVSVAIASGTTCKIKAISSQDRFDNRANVIKKLARLSQLCIQSRTPLWIHGKTEGLPPQLERAVNEYLDEAHSRTLAIIPLEEPAPHRDGDLDRRQIRPPQRLGALILEHFAREVSEQAHAQDLPLVVEQSSAALANARNANEILLAPLWLSLGKTWRWLWDDHRRKILTISAAVLTCILMLCFWPATMRLKVHGVAQPELRRNLFTELPGVIERVHVQPQQQVEAGDLLLEMDSLPLRLKRVEMAGQIDTLTEQIQSLDRQFAMFPRMPQEDALTLRGNIEQLTIQRTGLEKQLALIDRQLEALKIYSPIDGTILTWNTDRLASLPVQANQPVLTVAQIDGPWQLELMIPQGKLGYIRRAMEQQGDANLPADFILATDPNHRYRGRLIELADRGELGANGEVEFRAIVALDADQTIRQQPGAGVTVRIACGKRPLGLVWFHQIIDYVRTKVLF